MYTAASAVCTAVVAAIGFCTLGPVLHALPALLVGLGFAAPMVMIFATAHISRKRPILRHATWMGFNITAGIGLSSLGLFGMSLWLPAAVVAGLCTGAVMFWAKTAGPPVLDPGVPSIGVAALWGLTVGNLALLCLSAGPLLWAIEMAVGCLGLMMGACFMRLHLQQIKHEACLRDFDPLQQSLRLYTDILGVFVGLTRAVPCR